MVNVWYEICLKFLGVVIFEGYKEEIINVGVDNFEYVRSMMLC